MKTEKKMRKSDSFSSVKTTYSPPGIFTRLAWLPIPLFLIAIAVLFLLGPDKSYENPLLLLAMNFIFSFGVSSFITYLLVQSFLAQGVPGLLVLASGVLVWGFAGLIGIIAGMSGETSADFANIAITIHNSCIWVSALLQMGGVVLLSQPGRLDAGRGLSVGLAYGTVLGFVGLISVSALNGWMPAFFVQNQGGTPLRHLVLGSSIAIYLLTAALMWRHSHKSTTFMYWYCLALALIATGLFGVMLQTIHGGIVGWLGRSAQFLSGPYMLVAAILALHESNRKGSPLEEALVGRKRAEEALRESEDKYRRIVETANEGIVTTDTAGNITFVNTKMAGMLGYTLDELIGKQGVSLIDPEDIASLQFRVEERKKGEADSYDIRFVRKNGEFVWMHASGAPMHDTQGRHIGNLAMYTDITERRQAEEILKQKESDLRDAQRVAHIGSWYWDAKTDVTTGTNELMRIYGIDPEKESMPLFGEQKGRYYPVAEWERLNEAIQNTMQTGIGYELDLQAIRNGVPIWVTTRSEVIRDVNGRIIGLRGTVQDITERKRAVEALQKSEERYRTLVQYAPSGIYEFDCNSGRFSQVHDVMCRVLGYTRDELLAMKVSDIFDEEGKATFNVRMSQVQNGEEPKESVEYRVRTKDGRLIWVLLNMKFRRQNGKCAYATVVAHDITERKRVEEALLESEENYRRIVETANEGIMIADIAGNVSFVNTKMAVMLGYGVDELIGKQDVALICPDDIAQSQTRIEERKKEIVNSYEIRFIRKDGEFVWMHASGAPMHNSQGRHIGNLGMYVEITERKKADLEMMRLLDSNSSQRYFLETLIENSPIGIAVIDREHRYQLVNSAYKNIPNTPGINFIGRTIEETFPLVNNAGGFSKLEWIFRTSETDHIKAFETHIEGRETSYWDVDQLPLKDKNGKVERILIIAVDITEHKKAESSILAAKERIQSILESITDIYIFLDNDWRFVDLNSQAVSIIGKNRTELIGRIYWDVFPDAVDSEIHKRLNAARNERIPLHFEEYSKGVNKWMESHVYPSRDGLAFYLRDITERKQAEKELRRYANELASANKELQSFSYSVSHDLRTPLRAIKGFSDILLEDYFDKFDDDGRDILKRITTSTDRMALTIDNMLSLARISRESINYQEIDLSPIANSVVDEIRQTELERDVAINIADTLPAFADAQLMTIAYSNLIGNAWKYSSKNPNARIDIGIMEISTESVFFVRDNGAGFDMNLAHKLFQPFQRLHSNSQFPGIGIGLAIVNKIIQRHGGRIWAESEVGKGAAFYFTLSKSHREGVTDSAK